MNSVKDDEDWLKSHSKPMINAAAAKLFQSCPTLCDPIEGSPPGSTIPGILQARTLEWVALSFSNTWKWKVKVKLLVVSDSSWPHGLQPTRLLSPWDFPGKSTGVGCHCLLRSSSQILLIHNLYLSILQNRNLLHLQHADPKHSCLYNGCILNDVVMGFPLYVGGW